MSDKEVMDEFVKLAETKRNLERENNRLRFTIHQLENDCEEYRQRLMDLKEDNQTMQELLEYYRNKNEC